MFKKAERFLSKIRAIWKKAERFLWFTNISRPFTKISRPFYKYLSAFLKITKISRPFTKISRAFKRPRVPAQPLVVKKNFRVKFLIGCKPEVSWKFWKFQVNMGVLDCLECIKRVIFATKLTYSCDFKSLAVHCQAVWQGVVLLRMATVNINQNIANQKSVSI